MQLTIEQVTEMAPDANSAAAGKKLMAAKNWEQVGRSSDALWGLCRGSRTYQVKVDLSNLQYNCSCPSRKFPCKHVLGLLMLWSTTPDEAAEAAVPDWVSDWFERRRKKEQQKAERQASGAETKPVDEKSRQRRTARREQRVSDGLARLDVCFRDLVRNGLAAVETKPPSFWEEEAKRLVDAQAPGLAARVARMGRIVRSSPEWPERLLMELGRLKLLIHAWGRKDELSPQLQAEVRQIVGFSIDADQLQREGEQVEDTWSVVGQWVDDEDRVRAQRSWLVGRETARVALVLNFAAAGQAFGESFVPGTEQPGTLVFYPGTGRQRAKVLARDGNAALFDGRPPGSATIDDFFSAVAASTAEQPWLAAFGAMLYDVTLTPQDDRWFVVDRDGQSVPLAGRDHWKTLAITGGHPFDLAGEWNGYCLRPLGLLVAGNYRVV